MPTGSNFWSSEQGNRMKHRQKQENTPGKNSSATSRSGDTFPSEHCRISLTEPGSDTLPVVRRWVVGIGASAGGLDALKRLFSAMPVGTGLSFVVVMHLDPSRTSMLDEILARITRLNVRQVEDNGELEPDTVYVAPPRRQVTIRNDRLKLEEQLQPGRFHDQIDKFFCSLATAQGAHAIALVLSGTGSDGSIGARAVKEAGGVVMVQDETSAVYADMPRGVIAAGAADLVLPVESMPEHILKAVNCYCSATSPSTLTAEIDEQLVAIFRSVKARTGHDFSPYKVSTVMRRIERRMKVKCVAGLTEYAAILGKEPLEAHLLCQDMLIGVTSFFRDPEAFDVLRAEVFPRLFADRDPHEPVRIWHASCSTGEEVYSMAIMIMEYLKANELTTPVQFFATDIDEAALAHARAGIYPPGIGAEIGRERLEAFFDKTDAGFRVTKQLREMIVFAKHSLIKDPPFSRLDLLVCRNFLIYLKSDMQQRIISLFHLCLQPDGILFLGNSETIGRSTDLFSPVDKTWKIYQRLHSNRRDAAGIPFSLAHPRLGIARYVRPFDDEPLPGEIVGKQLVEMYAPPYVVVNDRYEAIYFSSRSNRFLEIPAGEPTRDLLKMARKELRPILRLAIHKAFAEQTQVVTRGVTCADDQHGATFDILVRPLNDLAPARKLAMVVFEPGASRTPPAITAGSGGAEIPAEAGAKDQLIRHLEEQLLMRDEQLQFTIEQLETTNEGLMSTNEELLSINEEFQSTNEELHSTNEELETSREELQALNEELVTVNAELQQKVEELNQANSDMDNLLTSSGIATIFLDRQLRIKRFTPAMAELLDLLPADIDRPFHHLFGKIDWPDLEQEMHGVLVGQAALEREVALLKRGRHFLTRVLPYRTSKGEIDGVVMTLIDITERKRLEARTVHLASFPGINPNPVMEVDVSGAITYVNPATTNILVALGLDGQNAAPFLPADLDRLIREWDRTTEATHPREVVIGDRVFAATVHLAPQLKVVRIYAFEITQSKLAESALRASEERYRGLFDHMLEGFAYCRMLFENGRATDFVYLSVNEAFGTLTGLKGVVGKKVTEIIPGIREADPELFDIYAGVALTGNPAKFEKYVASLKMWFSISVYSPEKEYFVAVFDVITERKKAEQRLQEREEIYSAIVNYAADGIVLIDTETLRFAEFNDAACASLGYSRDEFAAMTLRDIHDPEIAGGVEQYICCRDADHADLHMDHRHLHKNGELRDVRVSSRFVTVGGIAYLASVWHDFTDRKRAEEEREKTGRLESLGVLAGGIAHDFNNILTAVIGNISLARMKFGESHPASRQLDSCEKALDKATGLTRQLLTFARGGVPVKDTVDTEHLLREVVSFALHGSSCRGELDISPGLWPLDADAGQIHQALNNLIINAVQAMPDGGVVTIAATNETVRDGSDYALTPGRYLKITVADRGVGISEENISRIFDPYFTTKPAGTGLGLASVYSIINRHGGYIDVSSIPAHETIFTILLPAGDRRDGDETSRSGDTGVSPTVPPCTSVLLMDDEEMIRSLAADMLDGLGYRTVTCADGAAAVDIYREYWERGEPFSVVILDMTIPGGMGGREAAEKILAIHPEAVLIISSGYSVDSSYTGTNDPIFRGSVAKPYNISKLAQEIARLTSHDA
jgi:two-component system, chemotaxis family, CheB/CheR fusion protein